MDTAWKIFQHFPSLIRSFLFMEVNPLRGGRQQPLQSLEKLRKYKGGNKCHEMADPPSPKMWP